MNLNQGAQLRELLEALHNREPFFLELVGENGYKLLLGVGSDIGCAQYRAIDGRPPYLMSVANEKDDDGEYAEFLIADTATPVPRRFCVPSAVLKQIAVDFLETGAPSLTVRWQEI